MRTSLCIPDLSMPLQEFPSHADGGDGSIKTNAHSTPQSTLPKHLANTAITERARPPSGTSRERSDEALPSSAAYPEDPTNFAIVARPANIVRGLGIDIPELQGSAPRLALVFACDMDPASNGQGTHDKGTVKLARHVLSTSFHPEVSR